jgi:photosystem II stability/assembly factor-like uncharacterized protein
MKISAWRARRSLSVISLLISVLVCAQMYAAPPAGQKLTDPVVAQKLAVSVQQLHDLRARFDLSNDQVLAMPPAQLQTLLWQVTHPDIDLHAEAIKFHALRMRDEHGRIPPDGLVKAIEQRKLMGTDSSLFPVTPDPSLIVPDLSLVEPPAAGIQTNGWTWLGPGNIGGRVRSILVHPTSTNIMWCGGVDGGVWKTTNSGTAWFPLNDFMANLAIACLAMDPTNPNVIYAGTGEGEYNFDAIQGAGIFKTSDGGNTWTQLAATANPNYQYVNRLAISPTNSLVILAATRNGIFRSADGGVSWSQPSFTEMLDIAFHPTNGSKAIASGYNGQAFYSTNAGQTWNAATGLPAVGGFVVGRVEIAYSRSNPTVVFASVDNNNGEVYASTDGGQTYSLRSTGYAYLNGQGWYANALWVDPITTNNVLVGGLDIWRSTDGGVTFTQISQWFSEPNSAHADHHVIVNNPAYNGTTVKTVFCGDDGGVYRAFDVSTVSLTSGWLALNNNLGITQFYGGAGNSNTSVVVGGAQDNGTERYTTGGGPQGWTMYFGGDGGFAAADQTDPNYFYGEYVYLQIHRSTDGGASANYIYSGIADAGSSANFIAPFVLDPNNVNTMLGGGLSLWRSTDVKDPTPSWSAINGPIGSSSYISAIAIEPGNSDVIWVGYDDGSVYSTANGTAASPTWTQRNFGTPNLPSRYCGRIALAPGDPNRAYVVLGGFNVDNVWRTSDGGVTWSNITGNLPAAPMNSIVIAPNNTNTLYVGSEVGVFGTTNGGGVWSTSNDGPANVAVDELFWLGSKLVAVTHGRGMFSITPIVPGINLVPAGSVVSGGNGNGAVDPDECNLLNLLVSNLGSSNAMTVSATLTTSTPGATITQGTSTYPNLLPGVVGTNATPFQISTSPSFTCGTPVTVTLTVTYAGGTNILGYTLPSSSAGYTITQSNGIGIVPGTSDIGNHADDGTTTIALPFGFAFYGQVFSNATLSSNGNLQFLSSDTQYANTCLPYSGFNYAIAPFWDDLRTDCTSNGIFTSTSGITPNRIFNIEWRASYYNGSCAGASINFEVRLYETSSRFDIIYGTLNGDGSTATVGAQKDTGSVVNQFECNTAASLSNGLMLTYQVTCSDGGGACSTLTPFQMWQFQYFGSTNCALCGSNADFDGDGMNNLQEFLAGTDPTNSSSAFRITSILRTNNNIRVTWMTGVARTNALQATGGIGGGNYGTNNFADIFIVTNTVGTITNYLDVGSATNKPARYYRVRLVP